MAEVTYTAEVHNEDEHSLVFVADHYSYSAALDAAVSYARTMRDPRKVVITVEGK